jgi:hypothetical protein
MHKDRIRNYRQKKSCCLEASANNRVRSPTMDKESTTLVDILSLVTTSNVFVVELSGRSIAKRCLAWDHSALRRFNSVLIGFYELAKCQRLMPKKMTL